MKLYRTISAISSSRTLEEGVNVAKREGYELKDFELVDFKPYGSHIPGMHNWRVGLTVERAYAHSVPDCIECERKDGPSHYPSENCESGKYPHCSCGTCF